MSRILITMCLAGMLIPEFSCGGGTNTGPPPPAPDFKFSVNPQPLAITVGTTSPPAVFAIQAENGFTQAVTVITNGLPQGVTSSPAFPLTLTAGQFQEVTFSIASSLQTGSDTLQFQASGGGISKTGSLALNVEPAPVVQTYQTPSDRGGISQSAGGNVNNLGAREGTVGIGVLSHSLPGVAALQPARFALGLRAVFRTTPGLLSF